MGKVAKPLRLDSIFLRKTRNFRIDGLRKDERRKSTKKREKMEKLS